MLCTWMLLSGCGLMGDGPHANSYLPFTNLPVRFILDEGIFTSLKKHFMRLLLLLLFSCVMLLANAQTTQKIWTENDRNFLLEHLKQSRDQLMKETQNLTDTQWNFKESPDRWSIRQVVEHINIWELLLQREISLAYMGGPKPELAATATPDSVNLKNLTDTSAHIATDYTKPFTYSVPLGLNTGDNNMAWFLKMRNESIDFITSTKDDLRLYFSRPGRSIHYVYLSTYGHTDRHLRQIAKIKRHAGYPR